MAQLDFFFQAEDGIRDLYVTGVQTCALPISRAHRLALAKLDWLVVRDMVEIESAAFWYDGPEIESGELVTEEIPTEIFFLPASAHTEKDGSFTNTQRLLQWHWQAVEPRGDCRSDLWFYFHLGRLIRQRLAGSEERRDELI